MEIAYVIMVLFAIGVAAPGLGFALHSVDLIFLGIAAILLAVLLMVLNG